MKLSLFKLKILLYHGYCILSFIYHKVFWVNYGNIFGVLQHEEVMTFPFTNVKHKEVITIF